MSLPQESTLDIIKFCKLGDVNGIKDSLSRGADLWYIDADNQATLLHFACQSGSLDAVKTLLQEGYPWNAVDKSGYSAAEAARDANHTAIYDFLVEEGVRTELVLRLLQEKDDAEAEIPNQDYLQQRLKYSTDGRRLLDEDGNAVMMGWESGIMNRHVEIMCPEKDLEILNVGFGLGIIDGLIQQTHPKKHTIIEAHPDVYAHMIAQGWGEKPNVKILFGRWQEVLDQLDMYDGIFFDTYGEYLDDMRQFHEQVVIDRLKPDGVYSFFNGLAATNLFFYQVSCRLVEMDLSDLGLQVTWEKMEVSEADKEGVWEDVKQRYWELSHYWLPICCFRK